ncbi:MAG: hypothetical protein VX089_02670 [Pseudomonadota bacterium]|nr:hypothetical protein [Pseudomonadota bacterium]
MIDLVASPIAIGKTPSASGSSVPKCPIFFNYLEIEKDVCPFSL